MSQPTPPSLQPPVTPEQARAALQGMAEQLAPFRAAFRQVAEQYAANARRVMEPFRPLVEHVREHPEALEQWRRERDAEALLGSCRCLCGLHHREQPDIECESVAVPGLTVRYDSPTVGAQHVPMCGPCHGFHQERRIEQAIERGALSAQQPGPCEALPVTEAVTDTCTCHCWANHPSTPGVCAATSDPGSTLDGQPACQDCHDAAST